MAVEEEKSIFFYARALLYIVFACAYVSGVVLFIVEYDNYWASGGFSIVIGLIMVRLWQHLMPPEKLYMMFPVASWQRGLWQSVSFAAFLAALGVGLWLFARGLQKRQNWTGDSYFCSMTGVFMAAKWFMFVAIPIRDTRLDNMDVDTLKKVHALMVARGELELPRETEPFAEDVYTSPQLAKGVDEPKFESSVEQ